MANIATYRSADTPVHRLDARVKIVALAAVSLAALLVQSWWGMAALVALVAVAAALARLGAGDALRQLAPVGVVLVFTLLAPAVSLAPGEAGLHAAGLAVGAFNCLRIVVMLCGSLVLTQTTDPLAIARALDALLAPLARLRVPVRDVGTAVQIALRFIPVTLDEVDRVRRAQESRGANLARGGLVTRVRAWSAVFVPVFVALYRRADVLARAMDARCY